MHQTRKGNEWHFGMRLHIGVHIVSGLTHSLSTTAANHADVTEAHRLLRGDEREAWGDAGYQGIKQRPEHAGSEVEWRVAMRPGRRRTLSADSALAERERQQASLQAQVEHHFLYIKRRFGYDKVATAAWTRTTTDWRYCSASPICSSPSRNWPSLGRIPPSAGSASTMGPAAGPQQRP